MHASFFRAREQVEESRLPDLPLLLAEKAKKIAEIN